MSVLHPLLTTPGPRLSGGATDSIAGYRLLGCVARGGMGDVHRAVDLKLDREVAIKLLRAEHALSHDRRRRFVAEARRAGTLFHPNIVPVLEAGEADGVLFIAMPFVTGTDLRDGAAELRGRGTAHVVRVAHRVACALDAVHRQGLAHRDVKPANVLIPRSSPGHPLLTDFGLAAPFGEVSRPRQGTLAYLAPERWESGEVAASADVYALAAMCFELLTGEPALARTRAAHHARRRPSVSALRPTLPVALDAIIARGLAVDPAERPATVTALTRAIADVLEVELLDDDDEAHSPIPDGHPSPLTGSGDVTATR